MRHRTPRLKVLKVIKDFNDLKVVKVFNSAPRRKKAGAPATARPFLSRNNRLSGVAPRLSDYDRLAETIRIPVAATGFEPVDLLYGIYRVVSMARRGDFRAVNAYRRVVHPLGNKPAQAAVIQFFEPSGARWRGLGYIAESGLRLRPEYEQYDAVDRFHLTVGQTETHTPCRSGDIMRGMAAPPDCLCFGAECTPDHPGGPSMVSSEGVCAAYYRYHQKI